MSNIIRIYSWSSYATAAIWILLGAIIAGSIVMSTIGFVINVVIGTIVCLLGLYLLVRVRVTLRLRMAICKASDSAQYKDMSLQMTKLCAWELFLVSTSLLLGIIFLAGATYRVFIERMAVFG